MSEDLFIPDIAQEVLVTQPNGVKVYTEIWRRYYEAINDAVEKLIADLATATTKLATIETNADVTDAANVDAAGAVMWSDITAAASGTATATHTIDITLDSGDVLRVNGRLNP
ncbi:MAG: hypothetical protein AAFR11_05620 [Pseudomonadota bacterium]